MASSNVNYCDNHFERANLTPICGELTFKSLRKLRNEIKANARSVYSHLGGGAHVHIGLILTLAQYSLIVPTVSVRPSHPGPLIIPS